MENARRAAFSFFPMRSGGCAPEAFVVAKQPSAALSVTRRTFRHMTCGALAAFWKVEMFLSRCGADAPGKNERVASIMSAHTARHNNELKRAKDAICERPLKTPVLSVCIVLVIFSASFFFCPLFAAVFPRSDFFLLSNECVLKCSEVQYFPQNILK